MCRTYGSHFEFFFVYGWMLRICKNYKILRGMAIIAFTKSYMPVTFLLYRPKPEENPN